MRWLKRLLVLIGLAAGLWIGAHWYAEYRVRTAFSEAGMSEKGARCMSHRLVKRLSLWQLHKLEAFQEEKHTVGGMIRAARKVNDHKLISVTTSSMFLCTTGLAR